MSRRSRRRSGDARYVVERGEPYYRSTPYPVPPFRSSSFDAQSADVYGQLLELATSAEAAVYPWRPTPGAFPGFQSPPRRSYTGRGFRYFPPPRARRGAALSPGLSIRLPGRVRFCVQRAQRRQVLFALGRAGYSGSAPKRSYRRTQNSQWRC